MKSLAIAALCLFAAPLYAVDTEALCGDTLALGMLYQVRAMILSGSTYDIDSRIDRKIDELRDPLPDGGYRWVRWVRPAGDAPVDKHVHVVAATQGTTSDSFEASGGHAFAVKLVVPRKRSLLNANSPVYLGTAHVTFTLNGRERTKELAVNAWMNPDTSKTIDLGTIADRVEVALDASTAPKNVREAVIEIHLVQAVAQDDPANPAYDTIRLLGRIRNTTDPYTIDNEIARLERLLYPDAEPLPILGLIVDLRRAETLMRSSKEEEKQKGEKLLKETMRRLR